ncbi:hypothetical protein PVAND_013424 [Polypedilum vanderplanki]|uniref:Trichohyalin-plectin-homology domain-containing protein n=1 Tax=Polypedilum vanderplanki TaxID=319348 RepID=A0A9J6CQF7_POLVA|nr:hypothetical protein PVAND_013424 [Polypedilum vanderplanki]
MDSLTPRSNEDTLQDRINRMNVWKESRRKADEEFLKRQKIRMFLADCDEIRPGFRNQLLLDSKLCQKQQVIDQQKKLLETKDYDTVWHDVLIKDFQIKTDKEKSQLMQKRHEGLAVQDFLKHQMSEKIERDLQIHNEINKEKELIAQEQKDLIEEEFEKMRKEKKERKALKNEICKQINLNHEMRMKEHEKLLKIEQMNNQQILNEMLKDEAQRKADQEYFKREVFHYLDYLKQSRHQHDIEEREKEKLIEDIRKKKNEEEWNKRCELNKQRLQVNQEARRLQRLQLSLQEKAKIQEAVKEKEENQKFNERELSERLKMREEKWEQRIKAYRHGQELLEQQKAEKLRDAAEKQKLEEQLKLAAIERDRHERIGLEYLKAAEDLLPLHPNLVLINRGKKYI